MKKLFLSFALVLMFMGIIASCSDDIILEPLPSLIGDYKGKYRITFDLGQPNQTSKEYDIEWRFTDQKYFFFDVDPDEDPCVPSGNYALTGEVALTEIISGQTQVCNAELNPKGVFSLRQPNDSIVMAQIVDDMKKEILLIPK